MCDGFLNDKRQQLTHCGFSLDRMLCAPILFRFGTVGGGKDHSITAAYVYAHYYIKAAFLVNLCYAVCFADTLSLEAGTPTLPLEGKCCR